MSVNKRHIFHLLFDETEKTLRNWQFLLWAIYLQALSLKQADLKWISLPVSNCRISLTRMNPEFICRSNYHVSKYGKILSSIKRRLSSSLRSDRSFNTETFPYSDTVKLLRLRWDYVLGVSLPALSISFNACLCSEFCLSLDATY